MSKIGLMQLAGASFKPTITSATYEELQSIMENGEPINLTNGLIFSIPQKDGEDERESGSIWLTDSDGYLYCMTKPIKQNEQP